MTILNMVGVAGYLHATRYLKTTDHGDGLWLGDHRATRTGTLYPPHGVGPLVWYININRGDRFNYLMSMSSKARGMDLYAAEHLPGNTRSRIAGTSMAMSTRASFAR